MKGVFFAVLLIVAVIFSSSSIQPISSQSSAAVKVEASPSNPHVGETFTVTVSLANVQNLYGIEVILKWDSSVLEAAKIDTRLGVESHRDGVLHESTNTPPLFIAENNLATDKDEYRLVATSTSPATAFSGSGNIVTLTFNPKTIGSSQLTVQSQLYDYPPTDRDPRVSQPIDHTDQNTVVNILAKTAIPSNNPQTTQQPATSPSSIPTQVAPSNTIKPQADSQWSDYVLPIIAVIGLSGAILGLAVYKLRRR
jgi:hypothetical protein